MPEEQTPRKTKTVRKKKHGRTVITVVLWLLVIVLVALLILFLSARIGQFGSVGDMLAYIRSQI